MLIYISCDPLFHSKIDCNDLMEHALIMVITCIQFILKVILLNELLLCMHLIYLNHAI